MKKIIIIEDYDVILQSYKKMINDCPDFIVVGAYHNCEDALLEIQKKAPDYVITDITLPGMNGIEGIRHIKSKLPKASIVVVTVHENSQYVFDALCAGAIGYLTKSSGKEELLESLYQAKKGGAPMSINIARMVVESFQEKKLKELSARENNVITLLSEGKSYAVIGEELNVSLNTIKYHIRNIYEKLHVKNKVEAIKLFKSKTPVTFSN